MSANSQAVAPQASVYAHYVSDDSSDDSDNETRPIFSDKMLNIMKNFDINNVYDKNCIEINFNNNTYDMKFNDNITKYNETIFINKRKINLCTTFLYRLDDYDDCKFFDDFARYPEFYKYFFDNYILTQKGYRYLLIYTNTKNDPKNYYIEPIYKFMLLNQIKADRLNMHDSLCDFNIYKKRYDLPYIKMNNTGKFYLKYCRLYEYDLTTPSILFNDIINNETLFYINVGYKTTIREFNKQTIFDLIDDDININEYNINYIIDLFNIYNIIYPTFCKKNKDIYIYLIYLMSFHYKFTSYNLRLSRLLETLNLNIEPNTSDFQIDFINHIRRFKNELRKNINDVNIIIDELNKLDTNKFVHLKIDNLSNNGIDNKINFLSNLYKSLSKILDKYENISYHSIFINELSIPRGVYISLIDLLNNYDNLCKEY